jgi:hypothetical protein
MTAVTCDGASNMMGCKTGMVTVLVYKNVTQKWKRLQVRRQRLKVRGKSRVIGREKETVRKIGTRVM